MKYIHGIDYFLFFEDFPHSGVPGVIVMNSDATANIYINTLYSPAIRKRTIKHELRHLVKNHFYCDTMSLTEKEIEADDIDDESCVFAADFSWVEYTEPSEFVPLVRTLPGDPPPITVFRSTALPAGTTFGLTVPDNSMQPFFKAGDTLYCDDLPVCPGDIGLFQYRGNTVCRQYLLDPLGITYLFSLNRKRQYEDIVLPSSERNELVCLGRVRTNQRIPLPE